MLTDSFSLASSSGCSDGLEILPDTAAIKSESRDFTFSPVSGLARGSSSSSSSLDALSSRPGSELVELGTGDTTPWDEDDDD